MLFANPNDQRLAEAHALETRRNTPRPVMLIARSTRGINYTSATQNPFRLPIWFGAATAHVIHHVPLKLCRIEKNKTHVSRRHSPLPGQLDANESRGTIQYAAPLCRERLCPFSNCLSPIEALRHCANMFQVLLFKPRL